MEAIPIALFWSLAIGCLFQRKQALMYLFFASMAFGSFAVIPTEATGGLTLTPTPIVALLLIAREMGSIRGITRAADAALLRPGLRLLFLFWLVAGIATMFMPRFFANSVTVVPVRAGDAATTTLLGPTTQNLSQLIYMSISVLAVFTFASLLRDTAMRRHALAALCVGAAAMVLTGALDLASQYLPIGPALELFRTASYALLTDVEILDAKRIVGLMPEASSFGAVALSFLAALYFFRRAMPAGPMRDRLVPVLIVLLLLLIWLSTSSAAYLGLGLFGVIAVLDWCCRLVAPGGNPLLRRGVVTEFWLGTAGVCAALLVVIAAPHLLDPMREMIDVMVLQKSSTDSFEERSLWTQVSLHALLATNGLGVGLGSTRASNFAVAMASNAGVIGAGLYFLFVLQALVLRRVPRADMQGRALLSAVRWSYLPPFFAALLIGTTPDFGLFNAFLYGLAVAITQKGMQPARPATVRRVHGGRRPAAPLASARWRTCGDG